MPAVEAERVSFVTTHDSGSYVLVGDPSEGKPESEARIIFPLAASEAEGLGIFAAPGVAGAPDQAPERDPLSLFPDFMSEAA